MRYNKLLKPPHLEEGYKVMPPMDANKYPEMPGLEGPFTMMSGKVVYYDPKEGAYYDKDTDMFMSYDEFRQHDNDYGDMKDERDDVREKTEYSDKQIKMAFGILNDPRYRDGNYDGAYATIEKIAKGLARHPSVRNALKRANESVTMEAIPKSTMYGLVIDNEYVAKGSKESMRRMQKEKGGTVYNAPGKKVGDKAGTVKEETETKYAIISYPDTAISYIKNDGSGWTHIYDKSYGFEGPVDKADLEHAKEIAKEKIPSRMLEGDGRKTGIHPKGHPMRQKQQAAIHANSVDLNSMRDALNLKEGNDNDVVASYVRTMLNDNHDSWDKVKDQINYVTSLITEKNIVDNNQVFEILYRKNIQEHVDTRSVIKENIDSLRKIVKDKAYQTVKFSDGSMKVDLTTASMFLQVYDKQKPETQAKMDGMLSKKSGFLKLLDVMYSKMK